MRTSTSFTAFIAGHLPKPIVTEDHLLHQLNGLVEGVIKITIPNNNWNGYAFVHFDTKSDLDNFIRLKSIQLKGGKALIIKPLKMGASLAKYKKNYDLRRLFVRVRSSAKVKPDLKEIFSMYGEVEKITFIQESEIIEK